MIVRNLAVLLDAADLFPTGRKFRHMCSVDRTNSCGPGLNIYVDDGRQLRTASYIPTQSGIYYLQVTRIKDDQPVFRTGHGWSLLISETQTKMAMSDTCRCTSRRVGRDCAMRSPITRSPLRSAARR